MFSWRVFCLETRLGIPQYFGVTLPVKQTHVLSRWPVSKRWSAQGICLFMQDSSTVIDSILFLLCWLSFCEMCGLFNDEIVSGRIMPLMIIMIDDRLVTTPVLVFSYRGNQHVSWTIWRVMVVSSPRVYTFLSCDIARTQPLWNDATKIFVFHHHHGHWSGVLCVDVGTRITSTILFQLV